MARPLRVLVPGAWYHVMARGIERRTIYSDESYYRKFEELLANLPERFGVRLHTYVLMPNHYHLQIETPRLNLSEAIKWLNLSRNLRNSSGVPTVRMPAIDRHRNGCARRQ
jgi:REP element-mobilizing transposase RayT